MVSCLMFVSALRARSFVIACPWRLRHRRIDRGNRHRRNGRGRHKQSRLHSYLLVSSVTFTRIVSPFRFTTTATTSPGCLERSRKA